MALSPITRTGALRHNLFILLIQFLIQLLCLLPVTSAANVAVSGDKKYIETTTDSGKSIWLPDARKPALYTQDFGDCSGNSLINVTRFDAAYYKDNMTVLFHLEGNTNVANESLMSMEMVLQSLQGSQANHAQCTSVSSLTVKLDLISPSTHATLRSPGRNNCLHGLHY